MQNSRFTLRCALTLLGLSWVAALAGAQTSVRRSPLEREHRAETRTRYAQVAWAQGAVRKGLRNELTLAGWRSGALQSERGLVTRTFRPEQGDEAPNFVLETAVADSAAAAQEHLIGWLAGVQSDQTMPSLSEVGLSMGEAGFAGRSGAAQGALAWIAFVRGNIAVRVTACDLVRTPNLDLGAVAAAVDLAIQQESELPAGAVPARPKIETLALARTTATAGEVLRIDVAVTDSGTGEAHLQWIVGGPGQGYVERDAQGNWQLHTTGPGAIKLALEATGSTGTWTRSEVALNVLDD
jgi:hypothetical protein